MKFFRVYKKKALTLIEVVISLAILFIIMIPISTMAIQTIKMNKQAENKQQATVIAQKLMEEVKSLPEYTNRMLEGGVNIQEDENSSLDYKITGEIEGFRVEGTIKPSVNYKGKNIDETSKIKVDGRVKIKKEGINNNVYVDEIFAIGNPSEFYINKKATGTDLIFKNSTNTANKTISNTNSVVEIIADKDTSNQYNIRVSNGTNEILKIYCYKYNNSTVEFNVINEKGKVVYYDNLIKQEPSSEGSTINRVYDIYIKVAKRDSFYEIKSNKTMGR